MSENLWEYAVVVTALTWAVWMIARHTMRLFRGTSSCGSGNCGGCSQAQTPPAVLVSLSPLNEPAGKAGAGPSVG